MAISFISVDSDVPEPVIRALQQVELILKVQKVKLDGEEEADLEE